MKKMVTIILIIIAGLIVLFMSGPRVRINTQLKTFVIPEDIDKYLAESEARYPDIIPDREKKVIWAYPDKRKTRLSIIYLHGFSATRWESAPMSDNVAKRLGANLFYTRFVGHGRPSQALENTTINDFLNDVVEAYEIGRRLGDKVIVIGTSFGGVFGTWLALQPGHEEIKAYVFMSPCYGLDDPKSIIAILPWAKQLVPIIVGKEYVWNPINSLQPKYWTMRYPSISLLQPVRFTYHIRSSRLENIRKPVLIIYSPDDKVVDTKVVEECYRRFGSPVKKIVPITHSENPESHVLAGDVLAPGDTGRIADIVYEFITSL